MPMKFLLLFKAAIAVVPLPTKGSKTVVAVVADMTLSASSKGNGAG